MRLFILLFSALTIVTHISEAQITKKKLDLPDFHSIWVNSAYTVHLKQSNKNEVETDVQTEIYDLSTFEVRDGVLHINMEPKEDSKKKSVWAKIDDIKLRPNINLHIQMRDIKELRVNGIGKIIAGNSLAANNIKLVVSGSGSMEIDLKGQDLKASVSGSGNLSVKGYATHGKLEVSGSGSINAFDCELNTAEVIVSGSGNCDVKVSDELTATIMGSGNINHKGQTRNVTRKTFGQGTVTRAY